MEGTISEIRLFAGNFAPKTWQFCAGQLLNISTNQALFSLLGTTYGGNGVQTFALPDLRGRVAVGTGTGPGLPESTLGEINGFPTITATINNLPTHTHVGTTAQYSIKAFSDGGDKGTPAGNNLAALAGLFTEQPANSALQPINATLSVGVTGASQPINIMQPYIGMNYVICTNGIFPSRN